MARLWYRPSAAEFVVGLGAQAEMLDAAETSLDPQRFGRPALVPLTADTYTVYTAPDAGSPTTDLLDEEGNPITAWTSSTEFATLGRGPDFQGPDGYEGPLYISGDATVFFRVEPDSGPLYARMGAAETAIVEQGTTDLSDVAVTAPTDGQYLRYNSVTGEYEPTTPPGGAAELSELGDVDTTGATAGTSLVRGNDGVYRPGSGSGSWPVPGAPPTFPPDQHEHPMEQIAGSSVVGRSVLGAADQAAARAAIGAGTGSGSSNLLLGTTGDTAAPGNHIHDTRYYPRGDADLAFQKTIPVLYADQSDADLPIGTIYFRRAGDAPAPVDVPTLIGFEFGRIATTGTAATAPVPAGVAAGDMLLAICVGEAPTGDPAFTWPASWTTFSDVQRCGTMHWQAAAIAYTSETDVDVTFSGNYAGTAMMVILVRGADVVANWIAGTARRRADIVPSTTFNNEAPGLAAPADSLVLTMSMERTSASPDVPSSIAGTPTPVLWQYEAQAASPSLTTLWVGSVEIGSEQTTGVVTLAYPNTQSANGGAMQLAIPGAPA